MPFPAGGGSGSSRIFPLAATGAALAGVLALGCSRPSERFGRTFDSPELLANEVLGALAAGDLDHLRALPLTEKEFREEVYPELPAAGKIPDGFVWDDLRQKSVHQLRTTFARHRRRSYELEGLSFEGRVTPYDTFVVYRKPRLLVRDRATGERQQLALFGSVLEHGGRYKLFSYVAEH